MAERPGNEHEGAVARLMLAKFTAGTQTVQEETFYRRFLRREITFHEFMLSIKQEPTIEEKWVEEEMIRRAEELKRRQEEMRNPKPEPVVTPTPVVLPLPEPKTAIRLTWLRIRFGWKYHARIGERNVFACGKPWTQRFMIIDPDGRKRCQSCQYAIAVLDDIYGGASD